MGRRRTRGATARLSRTRSTPRCGSIRRCARLPTSLACLAGVEDGTVDAIATDHAPHTVVDKEVEFGLAANGISGIETALGLVLEAVGAGRLTLGRAIEALTTGPRRALRLPGAATIGRGFVEGSAADLVVFDVGDRWTVTPDALRSKGRNSPLIGRTLPGRVLLTLAGRAASPTPAKRSRPASRAERRGRAGPPGRPRSSSGSARRGASRPSARGCASPRRRGRRAARRR